MTPIAAPPFPDTSLCTSELKARSRDSAITEIVGRLGASVRDAELLRESLIRREKYASTDLGRGVAIPNTRSLAVSEPHCVLARSARGLAWDDAGHPAVHLVCAVITPAEWSEEMHYELLQRVTAPLRLQRQRQKLTETAGAAPLLARWKEAIA